MTETDTTPRVLFLCTHNAARSQMAEAFLRHYAGDRFEVLSAGLAPTHYLRNAELMRVDGHASASCSVILSLSVILGRP